MTLADLDLTAAVISPYSNDQDVVWEATGENASAVTVNGDTGEVTGVTPGEEVAISVRYSSNGSIATAYYYLRVTEIPNGTYALRNMGALMYADVENKVTPEDSRIQQYPYQGEVFQQWQFTHMGDGTYTIKSGCSESNLYMGVMGDSTAESANIILRSGSITAGMRWRIDTASDGAYKITPLTGVSSNKVLALGMGAISPAGTPTLQLTYTGNDDYSDEWQVVRILNFGFSTDNYTYGCGCNDNHGPRGSYHYAESFFSALGVESGVNPFNKIHNYNMAEVRTASKNDFNVGGAISADTDFMIYIGHGLLAEDNRGNRLHYSCDSNSNPLVCNCTNTDHNAYTSELRFGSSESRLRWAWLYTCNFLTTSEHVTDDHLKAMMTGAHIVMGHASASYLCDAMVEYFAGALINGIPIIQAFLNAGDQEALMARDTLNTADPIRTIVHKILYISQAENETIYSAPIDYEYISSDIQIITERYDVSNNT